MFVGIIVILCFQIIFGKLLDRIAFGSCYNPLHPALVDEIWKTIEDQQPNHLILLGDSIYADKKKMMFTFTHGDPLSIATLYETFLKNEKWQSLEAFLRRGLFIHRNDIIRS